MVSYESIDFSLFHCFDNVFQKDVGREARNYIKVAQT